MVVWINQFENGQVVGDACNGDEGLKLLAQTQPDIDGIEITKQLKQSQKNSETKRTGVIILTMHENEDSV